MVSRAEFFKSLSLKDLYILKPAKPVSHSNELLFLSAKVVFASPLLLLSVLLFHSVLIILPICKLAAPKTKLEVIISIIGAGLYENL